MIKKILSLVLCGVLLFGITGCGNNEKVEEKKDEGVTENTNESADNQTNKEYELQVLLGDEYIDELEKYDSEIFYYENAEISYSVPSKYKSVKKTALSGIYYEHFEYENSDGDKIMIDVKMSDRTYYSEDVDSGDLGEGLLKSELHFENLASEAFEGSEKEFDVKNIKVGNYNVFYAEFETNKLGYEESVNNNIAAAFNVGENYTAYITMSTFQYNQDIDEVSIETLKTIISSFKLTNY